MQVDEDDRDFRRSGIRGGRSTEGSVRGTRGGVTVSREPDSSTGGGQRGLETVGDKARATMVSTGGDLRGKRRRGEGEGVSSTGGRPGERNVRRVVKDRPWPEERRQAKSSFLSLLLPSLPFPSPSLPLPLPPFFP